MTKPLVILDPYWRSMDELFSKDSLDHLHKNFDVVWGVDQKIPDDVYSNALPDAFAIVAANPVLTSHDIHVAKQLKAVIEVSGAFPDTIDYVASANQGIEILSCSPGFRRSVAELGLSMLLAGARGLVREHEAFRTGKELWLDDCVGKDFTLYGAQIGFIGFGQISREITKLITPFGPHIRAFDPWLPASVANAHDIELCSLETVAHSSRAVFVNAVPTAENFQMVNKELLSQLSDNALVILLSRAHLVDFDVMIDELEKGRFVFACDVFPDEPLPAQNRLRSLPNVILSPHRAAAVHKGRHLIGDMVVNDLLAIAHDQKERQLLPSDPEQIQLLAGIGDAKKHGSLLK